MYQLAVVGCGYWGPNLLRNFNALPDCNVAVACDADKDRLDHMGTLYPGLKTTTRFETVLDNPAIDAVVVATPVRFHFEMARKCLLAGKHTFIEKPMASNTEQCKELIELSRINSLTLMIGHTFIYSPPVRKIKEIISNNALGEMQYISARRLNLGLFQTDIS